MDALRLVTTGPDDTRAVAAALTPELRAGDVVALSGDLGAGKTCFVQGVARALGIEQRVTSPTFVLLRTYDAWPRLVHCDVYRLDRVAEIADLGEDVMARDAITCIEWGDAISTVLPDDHLEIELRLDADDPDRRTLHLRASGGFETRLPELAAACAPWRAGDDPS